MLEEQERQSYACCLTRCEVTSRELYRGLRGHRSCCCGVVNCGPWGRGSCWYGGKPTLLPAAMVELVCCIAVRGATYGLENGTWPCKEAIVTIRLAAYRCADSDVTDTIRAATIALGSPT